MIEQARSLGLALASSEEYTHMKQAQANFESNEAIMALMRELEAKRAALVSALSEEPADSLLAIALTDDIDRLEAQLRESALYVAFSEAQQAFSAVLQTVNDEINACIGAPAHGSSACSGDCSSCGGCTH